MHRLYLTLAHIRKHCVSVFTHSVNVGSRLEDSFAFTKPYCTVKEEHNSLKKYT